MVLPIDGELLTAIIFYAILAVVIYRYRKHFTIMQKIFFVFKTKRPLGLMRRLGQHRVFWKIFSTLAIPTTVFFMLFAGQLLLENLIRIVEGTGQAGVGLLIPGVRIPGSPIFVPFWYGIISIAVLAIVHEFAHGIVAAMENVRLKSTGFGFLLILPLAFVELDEKQMAKRSRLTRLRISASGAFANIMFWLVIGTLASLTLIPLANGILVDSGVSIAGLEAGLPAETAGIMQGDIVTAVNNQTVVNIEDFAAAMSAVNPGDTVLIQTKDDVHFVTTVENPQNASRAHLGVLIEPNVVIEEGVKAQFGVLADAFLWLVGLVRWMVILNFLVGVMNFLPIWALDGGRVAYDLLGYFIKDQKLLMIALNLLFAFFVGLIVLNLIGPFLVGALA